ncbi:ADP-glyceromanno-heptose 6-epimerase [Desulfoplanes sp.]
MYIVTGGAGFIGSAMVWKLNRMGIEDILVVDNLSTGSKWKNLVGLRYSDYMHKSVFIDKVRSGGICGSVEGIVHMGACSSTTEQDADYLMDNNFHYTRTLAGFALDKRARFIYASSASTYGDGSQGFDDDPGKMDDLVPLNMYGYSKQLFDLWVKKNGLLDKVVGLKFFNVFGPNEYHKDDMKSVVCKAYHQITATGKMGLFKSYRPDYKHGEQKRDFVYVKDCVDVMWWLMTHGGVNGIYNVGTGQARTWNDLVLAVFRAMDKDPSIGYVDMPEAIRDKYQYYTHADMDRLRAAGCRLGMQSLEDAAADYVVNYLDREERTLRAGEK